MDPLSLQCHANPLYPIGERWTYTAVNVLDKIRQKWWAIDQVTHLKVFEAIVDHFLAFKDIIPISHQIHRSAEPALSHPSKKTVPYLLQSPIGLQHYNNLL